MKKSEIIVYTIIFFLLSFITFDVVFQALTNRHLLSFQQSTPKTVAIANTGNCSSEPILDGLSDAETPEISKLSKYQEACESFVSNRLMIFTDMPKDSIESVSKAKSMASTLREFSKNSIKPIVIIEPVTTWGLIDYNEFQDGFYDDWIDRYFEALAAEGIESSDMGVWVPFPEPNLPYWNNKNATPRDFSGVVNKYMSKLKKYFPDTPGSVLLNSATYDSSDFKWESGEYISLISYVEGLNKEYIESFGLQGFSWIPNSKSAGFGIFNATEYLNSRLAIEAARALGVNNIWLNTGSFRAKYTLDSELEVNLTAGKRKDVLSSIISEAIKIRDEGYDISINLFSEDKSNTAEATDWSYLPTAKDSDGEDLAVFKGFVRNLRDENIGLSLFDR